MPNYKSPEEWGPHFWYVMRCKAANYPINPNNKDKIDTKHFFDVITSSLPCDTCIKHYREVVAKNPIDKALCCQDCLVKWVASVQLDVNNKIKNQNARIGNIR